MKIKILVTGCGGDIGQSIGKILNELPNVKTLYGIDVSDKNAGKFIYKNFKIGPKCSDSNYIGFLEEFVLKNKIDLVIPVSEPELRYFTSHNINSEVITSRLLTASKLAMEVGFDKMKTIKFLEEHGRPHPTTYLLEELNGLNESEFPLILKSKTGSGSKDLHTVGDNETLLFFKNKYDNFIAQELISNKDGEYTCGVFRAKKGETRTIILKRELTGGYSGYGEVVYNEEISKLLLNIARDFELVGSINIQLRLRDNIPYVFEINPRFSSTVYFRHLFGFKDLVWSIEDFFDNKLIEYSPVDSGRKFYKGFNEYITD